MNKTTYYCYMSSTGYVFKTTTELDFDTTGFSKPTDATLSEDIGQQSRFITKSNFQIHERRIVCKWIETL